MRTTRLQMERMGHMDVIWIYNIYILFFSFRVASPRAIQAMANSPPVVMWPKWEGRQQDVEGC